MKGEKMKTILLTGANGGLGNAIAKRLLQENYQVILIYHQNKENIQELTKEYPNQTYSFKVDITNEEEVKKLKEDCVKRNLHIDALINNAGIDHVSEIEEKNAQTMLDVFKVNTLGPFLLAKEFGKEIDACRGTIINISSDNTIDANDYVTLEYDISKSGLNMLTKDLALYFKNARVNAIAFSWLDTKQNPIPEDIKPMIPFIPMEKAVKKVIEMMSSDKTGQIEVMK